MKSGYRTIEVLRIPLCRAALTLVAAFVAVSGASRARADEDAPALHSPAQSAPDQPEVPLPPDGRLFGLGQGADRAPHGSNDIYHEFGTVIPGGGRRANRVPADGGMVVGPGGVVPNAELQQRAPPPQPHVPTLQEKQAIIRKALRPPEPVALVRRKTLSDLYGKLAAASDATEAKTIAAAIETVWAHSGSPTADLLVARADQAINGKDYDVALRLLDRVVELKPDWAEGWNRRASVRYLAGDLNGATADVDRVLKLEPNHFAALNGLALILQRTGFDKRALQVYRRELAIYPHQPALEALVEKLATQVEGQGI